jgi:hypothetical protein
MFGIFKRTLSSTSELDTLPSSASCAGHRAIHNREQSHAELTTGFPIAPHSTRSFDKLSKLFPNQTRPSAILSIACAKLQTIMFLEAMSLTDCGKIAFGK